jgi:hypothetical protein
MAKGGEPIGIVPVFVESADPFPVDGAKVLLQPLAGQIGILFQGIPLPKRILAPQASAAQRLIELIEIGMVAHGY